MDLKWLAKADHRQIWREVGPRLSCERAYANGMIQAVVWDYDWEREDDDAAEAFHRALRQRGRS